MLKPYNIQLSRSAALPVPMVERVDYDALLKTLRFPLIWVYEHYLQAWLPREVDESFIKQLQAPTGRTQRRIELLGLNIDESQRLPWELLQERMAIDDAVVIKQLYPSGFCKLLAEYYVRQPEQHERWQDMPGIKRTSVNNSPLMRLVHQSTEKLARYVIGDIKTSYSFTSAYESGTTLPKHVDRPQCVYNASIMLASDPSDADLMVWPLMIETKTGLFKAALDIGDAVIYSGVNNRHWREQLPASVRGVLGAFFHYVPSSYAGSLD